jgi:hypothetical protein
MEATYFFKGIRKALNIESFSYVCGFYLVSIKDETCADIKYLMYPCFVEVKK